MYTTTYFAKKLIDLVQLKMDLCTGINLPDTFKCNWFENIRFENEMTAEKCHLDSDGYWIENNKSGHDGKSREYTHFQKFWWRIEPNYCTAGRPYYSSDFIEQIYRKSETRKDIYKLNNFTFALEWDGFDLPTETCWGLRMKPIHIVVYSNDYHKKIYVGLPINVRKQGWKKDFINFIENYKK